MYHIPVMLNESIEGLNIKPNGTYVDVTFGGGGHSRRILECLGEGGHLYALMVFLPISVFLLISLILLKRVSPHVLTVVSI